MRNLFIYSLVCLLNINGLAAKAILMKFGSVFQLSICQKYYNCSKYIHMSIQSMYEQFNSLCKALVKDEQSNSQSQSQFYSCPKIFILAARFLLRLLNLGYAMSVKYIEIKNLMKAKKINYRHVNLFYYILFIDK